MATTTLSLPRDYVAELDTSIHSDDTAFAEVMFALAFDRRLAYRGLADVVAAFTGVAPKAWFDRCQMLRAIERHREKGCLASRIVSATPHPPTDMPVGTYCF
jgi:hypothetical protein